MDNLAKSLLARLKNESKRANRTFQLCLQLFCQEEFLRRLSSSKYVENFILKGGLFLYAITQFGSRVTLDIDFLMRNIPNSTDSIKEIMQQIVEQKTSYDYVHFEILSIKPISVDKKYPGVSVSILGSILNTRTRFCIDIGIGDVVTPESQLRPYPTQLHGSDAPRILFYTLESTVAEKLDAAITMMEFSSRMKDYFDIYYLALNFDFSKELLSNAVQRTFINRGHSLNEDIFRRFLQIAELSVIQRRWNAFIKKRELPIAPPITDAFHLIDAFLSPVIAVADPNKTNEIMRWDHCSLRWCAIT